MGFLYSHKSFFSHVLGRTRKAFLVCLSHRKCHLGSTGLHYTDQPEPCPGGRPFLQTINLPPLETMEKSVMWIQLVGQDNTEGQVLAADGSYESSPAQVRYEMKRTPAVV